MILYSIATGLVAFALSAMFCEGKGIWSKRIDAGLNGISGLSFLLAAFLMIQLEPWAPPQSLAEPSGVHSKGTGAFYVLIMSAWQVGPQLTALALGAFAVFLLNSARKMQ